MTSTDESRSRRELAEELCQGLRVLEEGTFPKKCLSCGRVYASLQELVKETNLVSSKKSLADIGHPRGRPLVGLFRNCVCNSTLMVPCHDRRKKDPEAAGKRQQFDKMLATLGKAGVEPEVARKELRKVVRGENSEIIGPLMASAMAKAAKQQP